MGGNKTRIFNTDNQNMIALQSPEFVTYIYRPDFIESNLFLQISP